MFDLSWGEMLLVGAVALIVIGPKDLPRTLRAVGQVVGKVRRMASEFQGQFNQAIREAELDQVRKEVEGMGRAAQAGLNPAKAARDELKRAVEGKPTDKKPAAGPSLAKDRDAKDRDARAADGAPADGKASVVQSAEGKVSFVEASDDGAAHADARPAATAIDDPGAKAAQPPPPVQAPAPQPIPVASAAPAEKEEVKP
ncbi:Sec-independent protein translocase protein TatB [Salinarimonas rosea]|uniref:Sec-independent protein translocase protein TatB n=1 Tax=Salinarimonas rosea TaxID=552063 RepID=UPI00040E7DBA